MPYSDTNPQRRNLLVLSLAIITFYAADGRLMTEKLNFPLVNITFQETEFLIWGVWIALIWFLIRFWQVHRADNKQAINQALQNERNSKLIGRYAEKALNCSGLHQQRNGITITLLTRQWPKWTLDVRPILDFRLDENTNSLKVVPNWKSAPHKVHLNGIRGHLTELRTLTKLAVTQPELASYYLPYLAAWTAIAFGSVNLIAHTF